VAVLAGFLGSGKTTLLNHLLRDPRLADTAVAVNEFGEIPLDQHLIDHGADRTVVMANGCLCCNLAGDMEAGILRLFSRRGSGEVPRFARLIVELSGLSDPAPIAQAILRNPVLSRALRLETIVTTVDTLFARAQLARHPETGKQVGLADDIVLTKSDMVGAAAVADVMDELRAHNPVAPMLIARHGVLDVADLLPAGFLDLEAPPAPPRSALFADAACVPDDHRRRFAAVSLTAEAPLRWREFELWLRGVRLRHSERLLRVKAILRVDGVDGPVVVQGVHHVLHPAARLDRWPGPERQSRIVLIAEAAIAEPIRASWRDALPGLLATVPA
jgi:G3E family GTPase